MEHKRDVLIAIGVGMIIICFIAAGNVDYKTNAAEMAYRGEGNFELRNATSYDWGNSIVTDDGNEWCIQDPPEFEEGQHIKVLFDTKGTDDVTDDVIIDLWEVNEF